MPTDADLLYVSSLVLLVIWKNLKDERKGFEEPHPEVVVRNSINDRSHKNDCSSLACRRAPPLASTQECISDQPRRRWGIFSCTIWLDVIARGIQELEYAMLEESFRHRWILHFYALHDVRERFEGPPQHRVIHRMKKGYGDNVTSSKCKFDA